MGGSILRILFTLVICAAASNAQVDPTTLVGGVQAPYVSIRNTVTASAEKMPEEHYGFKPVPEVRSFADTLAHIADGAYLLCSFARAEKNPNPQMQHHEKTAAKNKAALRDVLKSAFAYCDSAYDGLTEAKALETVAFFNSKRVRLNVLSFFNAHTFQHYGNLITYMRLKGIVPPSSEPPPPKPKPAAE